MHPCAQRNSGAAGTAIELCEIASLPDVSFVPQVLSEAIPVGFKSNNVREASDVLMNFGRKCYVAVGIRIRVYIVQLTYEHLVAFLTPDKTRDVQADALVLVIVPVRTTVQIAGHLILHFFRTEA